MKKLISILVLTATVNVWAENTCPANGVNHPVGACVSYTVTGGTVMNQTCQANGIWSSPMNGECVSTSSPNNRTIKRVR